MIVGGWPYVASAYAVAAVLLGGYGLRLHLLRRSWARRLQTAAKGDHASTT